MKKIKIAFLLVATVLSSTLVSAQGTKEYTVDGIKVIHK